MKTSEEQNAIKEEINELKNKLSELTDEELAKVTGGSSLPIQAKIPWGQLAQVAPTSLEFAAGLGKVDDASILKKQWEKTGQL